MIDPGNDKEYLEVMVKVITGEATAGERQQLDSWMDDQPDRQQIYKEYRETWLSLDKVKGATFKDVDDEWRRLEQEIDSQENTGIYLENSRTTLKMRYRIAAAIAFFLVAAAAIIFYFGRDRQTILAANSATEQIKLADGSEVTLNAHAQLVYPQKFTGEQRIVKLTGEAFFNVKKDISKPFVIKTGSVNIEVLGTSFNVLNKKEVDKVEVVVAEGKVAIYKNNAPQEKIILSAGEKGIYNQGKLTQLKNNDINFDAWKTHKLVFEDTDLKTVTEILSNAYHANISVGNETLGQCPLTATFDRQSLDAVLKVIESTFNIEVKRKGDKIVLSGEGC